MDYVWDAAYTIGLTSSPSLASIPVFPSHCQRDLHQYYEVDPEIIGAGSFAFIRRVKLLRCPSNNTGTKDASKSNQSRVCLSDNNIAFDQYYACKTIKKSKVYDRELFLREIYNLNRCQSKTYGIANNGNHAREKDSTSCCRNDNNCVIRLLDVLEDRWSVHIITELCEGGELFDYVRNEHERTGRGLRGKALSPLSSHADGLLDGDEIRCATVVCQILTALRFLHEDASVCHRDLKASNFVFVDRPSYVPGSLNLKLIDFGLSKFVGRSQEDSDYRKAIQYGMNAIARLDDAEPKTINDIMNIQEATSSSGILQTATTIWNAVKQSYFDASSNGNYSTTSNDDDGTVTVLEGEEGVNNSALQAPEDNSVTSDAGNVYPVYDRSQDDELYAKHYQYMTSEVGTPYYVAPEVLRQQEYACQAEMSTATDDGDEIHTNTEIGYTTKCDIWSVGVLAFLTLTGTFPVIGKDEQETIQKLMDPNLEVDFSDDQLWEQDSAGTENACLGKDKTVVLKGIRKQGHQEKPKISNAALRFCKALLQRDPEKRPTAQEALKFDWIVRHCDESSFSSSPSSSFNTCAVTIEGTTLQQQLPRLPSLSTSHHQP